MITNPQAAIPKTIKVAIIIFIAGIWLNIDRAGQSTFHCRTEIVNNRPKRGRGISECRLGEAVGG